MRTKSKGTRKGIGTYVGEQKRQIVEEFDVTVILEMAV